MKNPFSGLFRARDKPRDAVSSAPSFYFGSSASGKSVTPSSAVQVSAVYACVRVIAETIASLPLHVYEATETGSRSFRLPDLCGLRQASRWRALAKPVIPSARR